MKPVDNVGVAVGVKGLQAAADTGTVSQSVSWAPTERKFGGEGAAGSAAPPWLEAELHKSPSRSL